MEHGLHGLDTDFFLFYKIKFKKKMLEIPVQIPKIRVPILLTGLLPFLPKN